MITFEELGISKEIVLALVDLGFEVPMPVQEKVIPLLLGEKTDIVALAQTGTGKTAAYGLPLIQQVDTDNALPQVLILSPTRELCVQIAGDLNDFAKYIDDLHVLPVYGGSSYDVQIKALKRGVQIVVATPGRLIDLMHRKAIKLRDVHSVVLDEADEMLNMGFQESINEILAEVPENRNTLLFSATMPREVAAIARNYMKNPVEITIGDRNAGAENIKHLYYTVHAKDKYTALKRIVDFYPSIYGIIFCRTRIDTQEIADKLIGDGYNAEALHGDLSQVQRDSVMQKFRIRHVQLLVATDVAARGLDVNDLTHIINYALPDDLSAYTHRSGRTGRAGKAGTSIAIINLKEKHYIRQIEKLINKPFIAAKVPGGREICEKQLFNLINKMENVEIEHAEIDPFLPAIYKKLEWLEKEDVIKRFVALEFNRFLEYYRNAKDINVYEEKGRESFRDKGGKESFRDKAGKESYREKGGKESFRDKGGKESFRDKGGKESFRDKGGRGESRKEATGFTRLVINAGKADGLYPNTLIELINTNSPGKRIRIGDITLGKNDGVFEVDTEYAKFLTEALSEADFKGSSLSVGIAKGESPVAANERSSFREKGKFKGDADFKRGKVSTEFKKGKGGADFKKGKDFTENKDSEIKSWIKSKGDNPFSGSEEWAGKKKKRKK